MGEVILVTSGKGGTGKTMFAVNMGVTLADQGKRVLLLDLDMGLRNADLYLGMESHCIYNVMDVISGVCKVQKAILRDPTHKNLFLMPATSGKDSKKIPAKHTKMLCEELKKFFDYIIIDSSTGIGASFDAAAAPADRVVLVVEPDAASVRDADTVERYLAANNIYNTCLVINRFDEDLAKEGYLLSDDAIDQTFRGYIMGKIPEDSRIRISTSQGQPFMEDTESELGELFAGIVDDIIKQ